MDIKAIIILYLIYFWMERPFMKQCIDKRRLLLEIELLRRQLINEGMIKGLNHEDVIDVSQQLDKLIILYQSLSLKE